MPAINKTSLGLNQWLGNEYPKRIDFVEDNKIIDDELIKRVKYTDVATDTTSGIVKFGTETGNAIDAETWKQAIGQSLGRYVSKVESKEAGKWYINDLTDGKIYKCIQTHTSTSFDITKFVDITNVGLSDKVENLLGFKTTNFNARNFNGSHKCNSKTFLIGIHMNAISNQGNTKFSDIKWIPNLNGEWYTTQIFDNFVNSEGFKISNKNGELKISYIDASNSGVNLIAIYEIFLN